MQRNTLMYLGVSLMFVGIITFIIVVVTLPEQSQGAPITILFALVAGYIIFPIGILLFLLSLLRYLKRPEASESQVGMFHKKINPIVAVIIISLGVIGIFLWLNLI